MKWRKRVAALVAAFLGAFGIDQGIKWFILERSPQGIEWSFFELGIYWNKGIAFSVEMPMALMVVLLGMALFFVLWIFIRELKKYSVLAGMATGLVLGGASGNILDRLRFGAVLDYIYVATGSIFNIADVCILVGLGMILVLSLLEKKKESSST